jgi:hypothetical protein
MKTLLILAALCLIFAPSANSQWLGYRTPGVPRTKDGHVDLNARVPRTRDGLPDLTGVWHVQTESEEEKRKQLPQISDSIQKTQLLGMEVSTVSKYVIDVLVDYKPGEITLTDPGKAAQQVRSKKHNDCLPVGMPKAVLGSFVFKFVKVPGLILMMLEEDSMTRQIYTDGRKLPSDPDPSWQGYSVGHWERDTLVVDTVGFNGKTLLDGSHPISPGMHLTERFTRRDVGHLDHQLTFEDPRYYNKPITIKVTHLLQPDSDILEYVCAENESDLAHMP